ncbi:HNH endonuclease family protein [Nocardia sp. NPDC051570]|uniref:HNH endonuclease family protein n=1 Tax=Nocardia sp. NPDC051570 TaxID=3364324 RepID=UPI0037AACDD0
MRIVVTLSVSLLAAVSLLCGCKATTGPVAGAGPVPPGPISPATAEQMLAQLPIKGRAPMTGYSRDQFGQAWTDDNSAPGGHNGCDTRDDILRRDLTDAKPATGCHITSGTLHDPYTGKSIVFVRGPKSTVVQIDHMVPLGDAWQTGAQQLPADRRRDLANDPRNLQSVDGPTNEQKGDGDAATWLPPQKPYRCAYVEHQVEVKSIYGLWVTRAEHDAIDGILHDC